MGFISSIPHNWSSHTFICCSPFHQQERLQPSSSAPHDATFGKGCCWQFLLPCPLHLSFYLFFSPREWSLSWGRLDFYKGSLTCGYLPKSALFWFYPNVAQRGSDWFVCSCWCLSPYCDLSAYYLIQKEVRLLSGPLVDSPGSHNFHRGIFVCGWVPNSVVKRGRQKGVISMLP